MQSFSELSRSIFRKYVRSAVIIDDRWPGEGIVPADDQKAFDSSEEVREDDAMEDVGPPGEVAVPSYRRDAEAEDDTDLLRVLQRALLREHVITCGVRYKQREHETAINLARRADIVVLDWYLVSDDGGKQALEILDALMDGALRFICIYTGQGRVKEVRNALDERWPSEKSESTKDSPGHLRIKNLVIAIRVKEGIEEDEPALTVSPDELFDHALGGLAQRFGGIVQLAMLEMTCRHREHVPEILEHIGKAMDMSVFFEASSEDSPVGPGGAFLNVLVDEWRSRLERDHDQFEVLSSRGRQIYGGHIAEIFGHRLSEKRLEGVAEDTTNKFTPSVLENWLKCGRVDHLPDVAGVEIGKDRGRLVAWTLLRGLSEEDSEEGVKASIVDPLLPLDALFHQQFDPPDCLTQGTVVGALGNSAEEYLICTTPLCDADDPRKIGGLFTFVRTSVIPTEGILSKRGKRRITDYCIIKHDGKYVCLEVLVKERVSLEVRETVFDATGTILARLSLGGRRESETKSDDGTCVKLRRIAQLRLDHALALSAASSADASRVGVNRVELIRSLIRR